MILCFDNVFNISAIFLPLALLATLMKPRGPSASILLEVAQPIPYVKESLMN